MSGIQIARFGGEFRWDVAPKKARTRRTRALSRPGTGTNSSLRVAARGLLVPGAGRARSTPRPAGAGRSAAKSAAHSAARSGAKRAAETRSQERSAERSHQQRSDSLSEKRKLNRRAPTGTCLGWDSESSAAYSVQVRAESEPRYVRTYRVQCTGKICRGNYVAVEAPPKVGNAACVRLGSNSVS